MNEIPTAEEFLDKKYPDFENLENGNIWVNIEETMIEFTRLHVETIKNIQQSKYYAGETGYITREEWEEIIKNIK